MTVYKRRFQRGDRTNMKKLLIAAAAFAALAVPAAASAADTSGTYNIAAAFGEQFKFTISCVLKDDGTGKVSGPCTPEGGQPPVASTGTIDATKFDVAYDTTFQGNPIHVEFKGDVAADGSIKGAILAGGNEGTFTATK